MVLKLSETSVWYSFSHHQIKYIRDIIRHHQIKYIRESDAFRRICKISQYLFREKYGLWVLSCNSQCVILENAKKKKIDNQLRSAKLLAKQKHPHIKMIHQNIGENHINDTYFWNNIMRSLKSNYINCSNRHYIYIYSKRW